MKERMLHDFAERWRRGGIEPGGVVLLHSSASRTLREMKQRYPGARPEDLLDSFLMAVDAPQGTLLLPLFNFDFTRGVPFDIRSTPSHMGILSDTARRHALAVRTGHPIYSFAAIGGQAERFQHVCNFSGYGPDSPFALLRELDGQIAVLDLEDQDSMTFYHHVEEMHDVPYRYHKTFTAPYIDITGLSRIATFGLFVRDLMRGVKTHVNPMSELLWSQNLYQGERALTGAGLRTIRARVLYSAVSDVILGERAEGLLYRIDPVDLPLLRGTK